MAESVGDVVFAGAIACPCSEPHHAAHQGSKNLLRPDRSGDALGRGGRTRCRAAGKNLLLQDSLAWPDARIEQTGLGYWRTAIGEGVDFGIETGGRLLPIEVKATSRPRPGDATDRRTFRVEHGTKAGPGLLMHAGTTVECLAPDVVAVPRWRRFQKKR
jgi:hypothetical protein